MDELELPQERARLFEADLFPRPASWEECGGVDSCIAGSRTAAGERFAGEGRQTVYTNPSPARKDTGNGEAGRKKMFSQT